MGRGKKATETLGFTSRVIVVYGPPAVGVTTVLECLKDASTLSTVTLPLESGETFEETVERLLTRVDVVFLDVEGGAFSSEEVQYLHDLRWVCPGRGALIRLWDYPENILARAEVHPTYKGSVTAKELADWDRDQRDVDAITRELSTPFYVIPLIDLANAVKMVALRSGMTR